MKQSVIGRALALVGALVGLGAASAVSFSQPTSGSPLAPPANGPRKAEPGEGWLALTGATVHVKPGTTIEHATVVLRAGKIVSVSPGGILPAGAKPRDCTGLHIYAGFIEPYLEVNVPKPDPDAPGSHWNSRVMPQRNALDTGGAGIDKKAAEQLRAMGFCAAAISPKGGIFRGNSGVVSLAERSADASEATPRVYLNHAYQCVSFDTAREEDRGARARTAANESRWSGYPDSQMGAIALIRQTLLDAGWQQKGRWDGYYKEPKNALDALTRPQEMSPSPGDATRDPRLVHLDPEFLLFDTADELEALRADAILREMGRAGAILGSGQEYRRLEALKTAHWPVVLPLLYSKTPRVGSIGEADSVAFTELVDWEQAPTNPRRLDEAGVFVALTTSKVPDKLGGRTSFSDHLSSAIKHGLKPESALAMLTTNSAAVLGLSDQLGTVEAGKNANLVIADGELFTDKPDAPRKDEPGYVRAARIIEVYIDGRRQPVASRERHDLAGVWNVVLEPGPKTGTNVRLTNEIDDGWPPEITLVKRTTDEQGKEQKATTKSKGMRFEDDPAGEPPSRFSFTFDHEPFGQSGVFTSEGIVEKTPDGKLVMRADATRADGVRFRWTATRTGEVPKELKKFAWAGTWTLVGPNGPLSPKDASEGRLVIERAGGGEDKGKDAGRKDEKDKAPGGEAPVRSPAASPSTGDSLAVQVKKGMADLPTEVVKFEQGGDAPVLVITVGGLVAANPDEKKTFILKPVPNNPDRLSAAAAENGPEVSQLARHRETPETDAITQVPAKLGLPLGPYAYEAVPAQGTVLITNATVWTCGPKGVIENGVVEVSLGKIRWVGTASEWETHFHGDHEDVTMPDGTIMRMLLPQNSARTEIDAKGKHVSPGIVDCHSHTGISKGVNEGGQAVTAEVRIGDVTDPDSISWYRQLASGVTTMNSLHGSANPIGGQNQVNKNRWGCIAPSDMHFEGAMPGIKFALGENVKQSNWGDNEKTRYPQTRMGVETIFRDRFAAAREYAKSITDAQSAAFKKDANAVMAGGGGIPTMGSLFTHPSPVRRDLELEALAEIIEGKRLIHCHSYRQDEILALCRIADEFGFKLGTFQHGLECYKVAEAVKTHAIGASLFADWWAYKAEVQDAIPYAGPILAEQGVVVSYNSDSDEMARRLNVEAGKALKYSTPAGGKGLSAEDALKFVTLNPAKQLKIDARVGSIEVGKDADIVIWSGPPLSSLSRCEATFVDGREMFSLAHDAELRKKNEAERTRIIQKVLAQSKSGGDHEKPDAGGDDKADKGPTDSGDSVGVEISLSDARRAGRSLLLMEVQQRAADKRSAHYLWLMQRGMDPRYFRSGDCGCDEWMLGN